MHVPRLSRSQPRNWLLSRASRPRRHMPGLVASLALMTGLVVPAVVLVGSSPAGAIPPSCSAPVASGSNEVVTCSYTGALQSWTVPTGVVSVTIMALGAGGGYGNGNSGGSGAGESGTFAVTPGTTLDVIVGQAGEGGIIGGGGGGGSYLYNATAPSPADPLIAAGGGGAGGALGSGEMAVPPRAALPRAAVLRAGAAAMAAASPPTPEAGAATTVEQPATAATVPPAMEDRVP